MILVKMFSRKWLSSTLLVFIGTAICIRLGIWQLDRLEQRRVFNAQFESMRASTALDLNQGIPADITKMEWRAVTVTGVYDFENQVAIRNRYQGDQYGYDLITPFLFDGGAVFIDRGWIPADENSAPEEWREYDEPGEIHVTGQIRLGQSKPAIGGVEDPPLPSGDARLVLWNNLDLTRISLQIPYPILAIFIQPDVDENDVRPPIPSQPEIEITEGPHFGYALQWFAFGVILFIGYPFFLRKQMQS